MIWRSHGDMLGGLPCTSVPWKKIAEPGPPLGATMPPCSTSLAMVSLSITHSGYDVVVRSCLASIAPLLWLRGMNHSGPLNSFTSSMNTARFMARASGMSSSAFQVP